MGKNKNNSSKGSGIVVATVATCILCAVIVGVGIYCWAKNSQAFFSLSVANCLTLLVAVLLSFFYVQKQAANDRTKADLRKQKDAAIRLLEALESAIKSQSAHTLPDDGNTESLLMTKRRISNFIQTLKKNADTFQINEELQMIEERFTEYSEIIGERMNDLEYFRKSQKDIQRPLLVMEAKIYDLIFTLYQ